MPSPRRWTPRTCSSSSTPPAPPGSRRGSSTPPAATSPRRPPRRSTSSTSRTSDVFWCTADIGWVTGHSYVVYGPLANGATVLMYEGAPDWPERDRFWEHRRAPRRHHLLHRAHGDPRLHEVGHRASRPGTTSPRCGCSARVGEPINPEAWIWYHEHIGGERCPIVDTWWQTETGGIMITPLPGVVTTKPGSATLPFPGIGAELVDAQGKPIDDGRRLPHAHRALARHAAHHLRRRRALPGDLLEPVSRAATSPATAPSWTTTATGGSWAGWTTC